jgi:hypothetical protein
MLDGGNGQDTASRGDGARTDASRREQSGPDSQEKPAAQDPESREGRPDSATVDPKAAREC